MHFADAERTYKFPLDATTCMTSENPHEARRRRWPHFKLSTILVLVAICAWVMASRPFWTSDEEIIELVVRTIHVADSWSPPPPPARFPLFYWKLERIAWGVSWPILALAAFLTWKLGWAIAARRKRRREGMV